jgi:hypothetical protein
MEKPPSRFNLVTFVFVAIVMLSMSIDKIVETDPRKYALILLIPASFVAGYFVAVLHQEPYKLINRLLVMVPGFIVVIGLITYFFLPDDSPTSLSLFAIGMSYLAGLFLAQASNRFRAIIKF